jgi:hypothetical protein
MKDGVYRDVRPDAQAFDEIRLKTVPRYTESDLSGDEWRISVSVKFMRKGQVVAAKHYSNMEYAVAFLAGDYHSGVDEGKAYFGGINDFCDQEGCANQSTVTLSKKHDYCRSGHKTEVSSPTIRKFCDEHKTRGDCGLDDADRNYTAL